MAHLVRVLFTTPYPTGAATGTGLFVRRMASHLEADGASAVIVEPGREVLPRGLGNLALAVRSAYLVFRHRRADVLHCQSPHLQSLVAGLVGRVLGKGVVLTVHGPPAMPRNARRHVLSWIERATLRVPHRRVFVAASLRDVYGGDGVVVPNGVPVVAIRAARAERDAVRRELGFGRDPVAAYVGRVTVDKGVWDLLAAVRDVRASGSSLRLLLVGPVGEEFRSHLAVPSPEVCAVGEVPNPWRYLAAADVFVLASTREGLPFSLLEAMALGMPTIATSVGGIPEVMEPGKTGLLVPAGDSEAIAHALRRILSRPEEARQMGARAAEVAASRYDSTTMYGAYRALYAEAVAEAANRPAGAM